MNLWTYDTPGWRNLVAVVMLAALMLWVTSGCTGPGGVVAEKTGVIVPLDPAHRLAEVRKDYRQLERDACFTCHRTAPSSDERPVDWIHIGIPDGLTQAADRCRFCHADFEVGGDWRPTEPALHPLGTKIPAWSPRVIMEVP